MSAVLEVTIDGKPVPWARHVGLGPSAHTPPRQVAMMKTIAQAVQYSGARRLRGFPRYWFQGLFYLPAPKDVLKADPEGVASEAIIVTARPDLDNWLKLPLDALNKIVWEDDAQIYSFDGSRRIYSLRPRLEIRIQGDGDRDAAIADSWGIRR